MMQRNTGGSGPLAQKAAAFVENGFAGAWAGRPGSRRPSRDEIARLAYRLAQERDFAPGAELDDWLEAERELNSAQARSRPF